MGITKTGFGLPDTTYGHYENWVRTTRYNIGAVRKLGSDYPIQHRGITKTGFGPPDTT